MKAMFSYQMGKQYRLNDNSVANDRLLATFLWKKKDEKPDF